MISENKYGKLRIDLTLKERKFIYEHQICAFSSRPKDLNCRYCIGLGYVSQNNLNVHWLHWDFDLYLCKYCLGTGVWPIPECELG